MKIQRLFGGLTQDSNGLKAGMSIHSLLGLMPEGQKKQPQEHTETDVSKTQSKYPDEKMLDSGFGEQLRLACGDLVHPELQGMAIYGL